MMGIRHCGVVAASVAVLMATGATAAGATVTPDPDYHGGACTHLVIPYPNYEGGACAQLVTPYPNYEGGAPSGQ